MAIWQYVFSLKSENSFSNLTIKELIGHFEDVFGPLLEEKNGMIVLGNYETDDFHIFIENEVISSILCRFDMRIITHEKVEKLMTHLSQTHLYIEDSENNILRSKSEFVKNMLQSYAAKFVQDPLGYLENISRDIDGEK